MIKRGRDVTLEYRKTTFLAKSLNVYYATNRLKQ